MSPKKTSRPPAKGSGATSTKATKFTSEERAAMKERAQELKAEAGRTSRTGAADGESAVVDSIAKMAEPDRTMASRLHTIIKSSAPTLSARTWYGMPAWAREGKVLCFFQSAQKFKTRYATLGFSDVAVLDDGVMWPTAFALKQLTAAEETRIRALLKRAVS